MQSWKKRGQRKRGNAQHTPMRGITRRRGPNVTRRNNASINPTKAKRKSISFSPVSSLNWTWTGKLRSHLSKILGISYSSIKTMTFQWESALELSSIVETHYTTDFSRILLFASDESLKISLPTYTSWWQDLFLSLSLFSLAKKTLKSFFVPRGLYPANGSIGRQSNCVAIRRVAIGERRRKERVVYSERGEENGEEGKDGEKGEEG